MMGIGDEVQAKGAQVQAKGAAGTYRTLAGLAGPGMTTGVVWRTGVAWDLLLDGIDGASADTKSPNELLMITCVARFMVSNPTFETRIDHE